MRPHFEKLSPDIKPGQAFRAFADNVSVAWLESFPGFGSLGLFSILGINPYLSLRIWNDHCLVDGKPFAGDPFMFLADFLDKNRSQPLPGLPLAGGCIGAVAYDAGFALNSLPVPERAASGLLASFDFYDDFLIFDHVTGENWQIACGRLRPAAESIAAVRQQILMSDDLDRSKQPEFGQLTRPGRDLYCEKVEYLRQQIRQGEVYIANLTHLFTVAGQISAPLLYDRLTAVIPAPFAAFLRQDDLEIMSASPERLLRIGSDRQIETRPIKGTRPRGQDAESDRALALELLNSGKDQAELLMITDLERNDLSKFCEDDSVRVSDLFALESYPAVHHLVSVIKGRLRPDISPVDAFLAMFPGGSITGAPKVAAMQIIDRLEDRAREFYTGSLGYFSFDGQADFNILIRSAFRHVDRLSYGAGGGITWESDPLDEYREMLLKADAFCRIVEKDGEN